jgi:hypothetical protein
MYTLVHRRFTFFCHKFNFLCLFFGVRPTAGVIKFLIFYVKISKQKDFMQKVFFKNRKN